MGAGGGARKDAVHIQPIRPSSTAYFDHVPCAPRRAEKNLFFASYYAAYSAAVSTAARPETGRGDAGGIRWITWPVALGVAQCPRVGRGVELGEEEREGGWLLPRGETGAHTCKQGGGKDQRVVMIDSKSAKIPAPCAVATD